MKAVVECALLLNLAIDRQAAEASGSLRRRVSPYLPVTQGGVMPDNTDLNPGDEAAPGTPGTGENLCPACNGSGKKEGQKCEQCNGTGKVIEGIGGA
jgi:hypothetical protein